MSTLKPEWMIIKVFKVLRNCWEWLNDTRQLLTISKGNGKLRFHVTWNRHEIWKYHFTCNLKMKKRNMIRECYAVQPWIIHASSGQSKHCFHLTKIYAIAELRGWVEREMCETVWNKFFPFDTLKRGKW